MALVMFVIPQITLAAWWNPVSWFDKWSLIFGQKEDTSIELLELKIKELESRIENDEVNSDNVKEVVLEDNQEESVPKPEVIIKEKVVYVEKPTSTEKEIATKPKEIEKIVPDNILSPDVNIVYSYIDQGTYVDSYGGEYGSILLGLRISTDKDIYIPKNTTDSAGNGIGIGYSLNKGDKFVGHRDSNVRCGITSSGHCKIRAGSIDKEITANVWIYPEDPGQYTTSFIKLGYKYNPKGIMNYIDINKTSEPLYVGY